MTEESSEMTLFPTWNITGCFGMYLYITLYSKNNFEKVTKIFMQGCQTWNYRWERKSTPRHSLTPGYTTALTSASLYFLLFGIVKIVNWINLSNTLCFKNHRKKVKYPLQRQGVLNRLTNHAAPGNSCDRRFCSNCWAVRGTLLQSILDN